MKIRPPRLRLTACVAVSLFCASTTSIAAQELDQFQGRLASTFSARGFSKATWGVLVVSLDTGDTLFAIDPDRPLAPASNLKLLTTTAALRILGPDYRFRTYLLTDGTVENGVLDGDLILYGTGDPGISDRFYRSRDEVFQRLIDQLEELGIHSVTGDLVGDASFFAGPLRPEGWDPRDLNDHFTGAVSALSFNENVVSFRVVPGETGAPPSVQTVPAHAGLEVVNEAETVTQRRAPAPRDPAGRSAGSRAHRGPHARLVPRRVEADDGPGPGTLRRLRLPLHLGGEGDHGGRAGSGSWTSRPDP